MIAHTDRAPLYPGRVKMTPVSGQADVYDMVRQDQPSQAGTPLNKALLDEFLAAQGTTAGSATALTLAQPGFVLKDGATVRIKLHVAPSAGAKLNVASTGAKAIMDSRGKPLAIGVVAGSYMTLVYNGTNFILQGDGSGATKKYHSNTFVALMGLTAAKGKVVG